VVRRRAGPLASVGSGSPTRAPTVATAPTEPRTDIDAVLEEAAVAGREAAREGTVEEDNPKRGSPSTPDAFGVALTELNGEEHLHGDVDVRFPIQSISKAFALVLAMQKVDERSAVSDELWCRIGREPSGDPFNSLVQLEHERGIPRNPMINAGALVVDDVLIDFCDDPKAEFVELLSELCGESIEADPVVAGAELEDSHRNLAVANLMASFDNLRNPVMDVLDVYVHQCALSMSARQLARAVRFLANDGVDPASGRRVLPDILARRINSLLLTCGTYDAAGAFAFEVGLPCKSGVAGGIIAVVPDEMGVCVWSPALDETGNSRGGRVALHELAEKLHLSIF
jgi:glutaminase